MAKRRGAGERGTNDWFRSVEHDASAIVHRVMEEIDEVAAAMAATEKSLAGSREALHKGLRQQEDEFCRNLAAKLEQAGFGPFPSRIELVSFISETDADDLIGADEGAAESSPRLEAYWAWQHFEQRQHMENRVELSERPTLFTRYGAIIAIHALLESALQEFCQLAKERRKSRLAVEDLAKSGADGFKERRYLEKVHGVEVESTLWDALIPLVFVRNRIAHSSGKVHGFRSTRDFSMLTQTPGLGVQGTVLDEHRFASGYLKVEPEFVQSFVRAIYALLKALELKFAHWDGLRSVRAEA
jgi:hypothetical protein